MKTLVATLSFILIGIFTSQAMAQVGTPDDPPRDGYYDKIHYPNRRVVPYPYLREADVMWTRRVWRKIDLREKINQPMYYPTKPTNLRKNLITILQDAVIRSEPFQLKGYDPYSGDDFKVQMTVAEISQIGVRNDTTQIPYPFPPYDMHDTVFIEEFKPERVTQYYLKEDWYFEKQRSVMEPRILGICPMMKKYADDGTYMGMQPMYWLYFPAVRAVLINEEVYNPYNFGSRITYDDLFMKRMFNSLIYKVDNVHDRLIEEYTKGLDALLEAENIKDIIFKFEHDVWEQ